MRSPSPVLQLRAGRYTAGDAARSGDGEASLALLPGWGGENAWGLDAVLAVAEDLPDLDGGEENPLLRDLQEGLRETPVDGNVTPLLADLLGGIVKMASGTADTVHPP